MPAKNKMSLIQFADDIEAILVTNYGKSEDEANQLIVANESLLERLEALEVSAADAAKQLAEK